jgi:NADH-quinone oxidoreductase subunit N
LDFYDILFLSYDFGLYGFQKSFVIVGFILMVFGFFFKLAIFPFHTWAPDTYDGSSWLTVFVIALIPKIGALLLLIKIISLFSSIFVDLELFFRYCGLSSIIFGAISAVYQVRIKRFLAYSSISNLGYILLTLSISSGPLSVIFAVQYLIIYVFVLLGLFGVLLNLRYFGVSAPLNTFYDLNILANTKKPLAWAISLFVMSFAGLPPLAGF